MAEQEEIIGNLHLNKTNNVDDEEIMMRMRYVDKNGNRFPLLRNHSCN